MKKSSEFLSSLPEKAQKKITYNVLKVEGGEINKELFKKLDDTEFWEFRTLFNGVSYRLFAFWDTTSDTLIVATKNPGCKLQKQQIVTCSPDFFLLDFLWEKE